MKYCGTNCRVGGGNTTFCRGGKCLVYQEEKGKVKLLTIIHSARRRGKFHPYFMLLYFELVCRFNSHTWKSAFPHWKW